MVIQFEGEAKMRARMTELQKQRRSEEIAAEHGREVRRSKLTSIRLRPEIFEYYKSLGPGWQAHMNDVLRDAIPPGALDLARAKVNLKASQAPACEDVEAGKGHDDKVHAGNHAGKKRAKANRR